MFFGKWIPAISEVVVERVVEEGAWFYSGDVSRMDRQKHHHDPGAVTDSREMALLKNGTRQQSGKTND